MSELDEFISELEEVDELLLSFDCISTDDFSEKSWELISVLEARQSELREIISDITPENIDDLF